MIALNIIFQKVFRLPKSRWPAMKDKTVNIPVFEADVMKTVETLPRTPNEAGIIPINLKRRLSYNSCHKTQYVSVPKLIKALETLKSLGNQYYQFVPDMDKFKERCRETDTEGFSLIFPKDELYEDIGETIHINNDRASNIQDEICPDYEEIAKTLEPEEKEEIEDQQELEEEEYIKKRPCEKMAV